MSDSRHGAAVEAIADRLGPPVLVFLARAQGSQGIAEDVVKMLVYVIDDLINVAVRHGAPVAPGWWDFIADDLAALGDQLNAQHECASVLAFLRDTSQKEAS